MDDFSSIQNFHFIRPYWLLLFLAYWWGWKALSRRDDSTVFWRRSMSKEILEKLTIPGTDNQWLSPKRLSIVIMLLTSVVLAGPAWKQQESPFSEDQAALVIALDVSKTMGQSDVQPTRLLKAKQKILDLLAIRGDANTGLIAFSGSAHVVMPVTNDREMIRHFLDALDSTVMPIDGKFPETVLPLFRQLMASSTVPGTLLIVGDGATSGTVSAFKGFFNQQKHQLIVWAIGNLDTGNIDKDSPWIPVQLAQLASLASSSDGRLVEMTHDKQDVVSVYKYIDNNLVIVDDGSRPWHDSGYYLLFIIMPMFLFWFRRGWTLQW